jgi:hypothetical protein
MFDWEWESATGCRGKIRNISSGKAKQRFRRGSKITIARMRL